MWAFEEWAVFTVVVVALAWVGYTFVKMPGLKAARRAAELSYADRREYVAAFRLLADAVDSAYAVVEQSYPDFPGDVREQLRLAHDAGRNVTTRRHISASEPEG